MKLPFFSQVRVVNSTRFPEYNGKLGVVVGISEEDGRVFGYAVSFPYTNDEGLDLEPGEIESTGEIVDRSLIYDDSPPIKVRVIEGEGFLVDDE